MLGVVSAPELTLYFVCFSDVAVQKQSHDVTTSAGSTGEVSVRFCLLPVVMAPLKSTTHNDQCEYRCKHAVDSDWHHESYCHDHHQCHHVRVSLDGQDQA